jgi:hypothetical protein
MSALPPLPGLPFQLPLLQIPTSNTPAPTLQQLAAQGTAFVNTLLAQLTSNPVSLLAAPFILPAALSLQLGQKVQGGTLTPRTVSVSTLMSGVASTVMPPGTTVASAQLFNNGPGSMAIIANPAGGNPSGAAESVVPPGQPFNFGSIDLGQVYFLGGPGNNAIVNGSLYMES